MKKKLIISFSIITITLFYFCITWFSYSGGTWVSSENNLQYTYLRHVNYNLNVAAVIHPFYSKNGQQDQSVRIDNNSILFKDKPIEFTSRQSLALISHDE